MKDYVRASKFLSLVLRHRPELIGVQLDPQGWVPVEQLLTATQAHGRPISRAQLERLVRENDKQRFAFSPDGTRIRANQGHSVAVELELEPAVPPEVLFHGTADRFLPSIAAHGLLPGQRHHVHLSGDAATARKVGSRHGCPIVLQVEAGRMHQDGHPFCCSQNGIWLTDHVPTEYLCFPKA